MSWKTKTHTLLHAINHGGQSYEKISLREPDLDALEAIENLGVNEGEKPTVSQIRGMIEALADLPSDVIGKMHRDDFMGVSAFVVPLLTGIEKAPEEPSST